MAHPRKRKRTKMPTVTEETEAKLPQSEQDKQQIGKDDHLSNRCLQCGFPCWLCSIDNASGPGQEDPARWWSEAEEEVMETESCSKSKTTTLRTKSTKPKFDESNRLFITVKDHRFAELLKMSNIRLESFPTNTDPIVVDFQAGPKSTVILTVNDDELEVISRELVERKADGYNEKEFRTYLDQELVGQDRISTVEGTCLLVKISYHLRIF